MRCLTYIFPLLFSASQDICQEAAEIDSLRQALVVQRAILVAAFLVCLLIAYLLWRASVFNKVLFERNRHLMAEIAQQRQAATAPREESAEPPKAEAAEQLTANQQLYGRLCEVMKNPDIFTDPDTNLDSLASLIGTNRTYVHDALRECASQTPTDFINGYRLRHAAHLLVTTSDSVGLIAELCGLSRRTFYRLFNELYSMSPSDYRRVAHK